MNIITAPHPTLRTPAQEITHVDKKVLQFMEDLKATLLSHTKPRGVGLAAPQVDKKWRAFVTNLITPENRSQSPAKRARVYLNPVIVKHSAEVTFGLDEDDNPTLEGCLSIPKLWGPVPRFEWVDLEFQEIQGDHLVSAKMRVDNFAARVIQHEVDHLNGVLFTDYSLEYDLPIYHENPTTKRFEEIPDRKILEIL